MKKILLAASLLALASGAMATNVGVSVSVGDPNFYGRIDVGNVAPPPVVYQQPVLVQRPVHYVEQAPVYMRVPPGHAKHWAKHCGRYNACGRPVYFVQDRWYVNEYAPRYRERHVDYRNDYRGPREHYDHGHRGHDDHGNHGHGNGHGNGHGHGRDRD